MKAKTLTVKINRDRTKQSKFTKKFQLFCLFQLEEQRRIEEDYDEKLRLEREIRDREEQELSRQERHKQRELMKELRAKRASEREVALAMKQLQDQQKEDVSVNSQILFLQLQNFLSDNKCPFFH